MRGERLRRQEKEKEEREGQRVAEKVEAEAAAEAGRFRARRLAAWEPLMKGVALMGVVAQALGLANRRLGWHGLS